MFKRRFASEAWTAQRRLAELCEMAHLSEIQAEVIRLKVAKTSYRGIADGIGIPYQSVRNAARKAEAKLRERHVWMRHELRHELFRLLACMRNIGNPKPGVAVFQQIPGGYDETPVRLSSTPHGLDAEDLIDTPGRLLTWLPELIEKPPPAPELLAGEYGG